MSYYAANMKAIEQTKEYLFQKINEYKISDNDRKKLIISTLTSKDEDRSLIITKDAKEYRMNSVYSPSHEANRWAAQFNLMNIGIVASMFGLGNGAYARELGSRLADKGALLIYEPSAEIFFYIMENYDITDILSATNISITVEGINDIEFMNLLGNHVDWLNIRSQIACSYPNYDILFPDNMKRFYKLLQDNNDKVVINKNTDVAISRVLIDNSIKNLSCIQGNNLVMDLVGIFPEDVPAIIVSAGPSLDKNITETKKAKGKAVIFAVDSAVKYLLAQDIVPDFIVTLDPNKSIKHLKDPRCRDIPIFSRIEARPANLKSNSKRIVFYNLEGYIKTLFMKLGKTVGTLNSGGSVATGAFSICETLGFKRIILVGQDLAYSGDYTHAGGKNVDVSNAGELTEIVEDINGNPIKTRCDWYIYLRWFNEAVELFDGEEVIDATEGGAKIKGTTVLTLSDAIEKYCMGTVDCEQIISNLKPSFDEREIHEISRFIKEDIKDLEKIRLKAKEADEICDRLIDKYEKSLAETSSSIYKNKLLLEYNTEMDNYDIYSLIDIDISASTTNQLSKLYLYYDDEKKDKLATYKQSGIVYKAILQSVDRLKPLLESKIAEFDNSNA